MKTISLTPIREFVKAVVDTFVEERLQRFPDTPEMLRFFQQGKAYLVIAHDNCESFLRMAQSRENDPLFGRVCAALPQAPIRYTQRLFCTLQLIHAYRYHLVDPQGTRGWLNLVTEGACDIYGQPGELFVRLRNDENKWLEQQPTSNVEERSLRFAHCATVDLFNELQCGTPHVNASIAAAEAFAELFRGSTADLDQQGMVNVSEWLLALNWDTK